MDTKQADQHKLLALEATQVRTRCQHHWILDAPAGPVSKGACRSCGEERCFPNYIEGRFNNRRSDVPPKYQTEIVEKTLEGLLPRAQERERT